MFSIHQPALQQRGGVKSQLVRCEGRPEPCSSTIDVGECCSRNAAEKDFISKIAFFINPLTVALIHATNLLCPE